MLRNRAKSAKTSPEATLADLNITKAALEARLPALEEAKAEALARRRDALIADPDGAAVSEAAQAARNAEGDLAAVSDTLQEVERRIAEASERLRAEQNRTRREDVAKALEADANKVAEAAEAISAAVDQIVRAHSRMALAISPQSAPQMLARRDRMSPTTFADGVLLQAVAAALPGLRFDGKVFPNEHTVVKRVEGRDAVEAGAAAAERLRDVAAKIRNGDVGSDLPEWVDGPASITVSEPATVAIAAAKCFSWIGWSGKVCRVTPGNLEVPAPVAEAAISAGIAKGDVDWLDATRAKAAWDDHLFDRTGRRRDLTPAEAFVGWEVVDLGVDLRDWRRAEEDRQRAEWKAAQEAERAELERRAA